MWILAKKLPRLQKKAVFNKFTNTTFLCRHFIGVIFSQFFFQNTSSFAKKRPVDFDDELKIGDVRYDNMTKITIKVQLFWRLPYEM